MRFESTDMVWRQSQAEKRLEALRNGVLPQIAEELYPRYKRGVLAKAKSAGAALVRSAKRNRRGLNILVTDAEAKKRWDICVSCDEFVSTGQHKGKCNLCGCGLQRKVKLASEWCPIGNWGKDDTVCVLISAVSTEPHLQKTLESVRARADGQIEFRVQYDTQGEGLRVILNRLAKSTKAKYLLKLDAHCDMSLSWDTKLKESCTEGTLVFPALVGMDAKFVHTGTKHGPASLNTDLVEKWWPDKIDEPHEVMANTGCGLFMRRTDFERLGRFDESLGRYGGLGPETSLKFWLSGGRVVHDPSVVCGHIYKKVADHDTTNEDLQHTYDRIRQYTYNGLWSGQIHHIGWLVGKFWPVPGWERTWIPSQQVTERIEYINEYYA